jgi:hypothetical protein
LVDETQVCQNEKKAMVSLFSYITAGSLLEQEVRDCATERFKKHQGIHRQFAQNEFVDF